MAHSMNHSSSNHHVNDLSDGEHGEDDIDPIIQDIGDNDLLDDQEALARSRPVSPETNYCHEPPRPPNTNGGEQNPHLCNGHDDRLMNGIDFPDEGIDEMEEGIAAPYENSNFMNDFIDEDIDTTESTNDFNDRDNDLNPRPSVLDDFEPEMMVVNRIDTLNGHVDEIQGDIGDDLDYNEELSTHALNNRTDSFERRHVEVNSHVECGQGRNCLCFDRESSHRCHCNISHDDVDLSNNEHHANSVQYDDDSWIDEIEEIDENLEGAVGGYDICNDDSNHSNSNMDADDEREREEPTEEDKLAAEIINFGLMSFRSGRHKVKDILKKVARSKYANMIDFNKLIEDIHLYELRYRAKEAKDRELESSGSTNDEDGAEIEDVNRLDDEGEEVEDEEEEEEEDIGCQAESNNVEMRLNYKRPDDHNNFDYLSMISQYDNPLTFGDSCDDDDRKDEPTTPMKADDDTVFLWTFEEAVARQVRQIGASACGATAIINVLNCLYMCPDIKIVTDAIPTHLRANHAPLPEYLFSRSVAGTTHEDLINGLNQLTEGRVYGRFFPFYPKRDVDLKEWLATWMRKGVVPLATLNLQKGQEPGWKIPDAWHHQMVHGLGPDGIYLTNPLVTESVDRLHQQLCSDSVLLVRKYDVLGRWNEETDLTPLMVHPDKRWAEMNVLGQVVNMIRERTPPAIHYPGPSFGQQSHGLGFGQQSYRLMTTHIKIPAAYKSGITLFVKKSKHDVYNELLKAPDLPILEQSGEISNICVASGRMCRKL